MRKEAMEMADKMPEPEVSFPSEQQIIAALVGDKFFGRNTERLVSVLGPLAQQLGGLTLPAAAIADRVITVAGEYASAFSTDSLSTVQESDALEAATRLLPLLIGNGEITTNVVAAIEIRQRALAKSIEKEVMSMLAAQPHQGGQR